jgi:uncharacterized protein YjiS (DUF1127 family)
MEMIMSTISNAVLPRNSAGDTLSKSIAKVAMRWWVAYMNWRLQRLAIHRLKAMSDRELKDMGVSRSQIDFVVKRGTDFHPMFSRYY